MSSALLKSGWSKPSAILFAVQIPANETAFAFALTQAVAFGAALILFHAYDTLVVSASDAAGGSYCDATAAAAVASEHLQPLARRARHAGVACSTVVRPGLAADQILQFLRERAGTQPIDRIVLSAHSSGLIGQQLVGSVAEVLLRSAEAPVYIVGPDAVDGTYRKFATQAILCAVSLHESSSMVVGFAAQLAVQHQARLILQHVIQPQQSHEILAGRSIKQMEGDLLTMLPKALRAKIKAQAIVVPGDPTEELLLQARAQQADLIVLGAQEASAFAALTRHGVVYKVLAHSHCPVMTLSPVLLAPAGNNSTKTKPHEIFLAGVF